MDARQLAKIDEISLDDPAYIVKLLSKLRIVKWSQPKSLGAASKKKSDYISDLIVNYKTLPLAQFEIQVQLALQPAHSCSNNDEIDISQAAQEALNTIFPPQTWTENGNQYYQQISYLTSSRGETSQLQESIRQLLLQAQARVEGICPIRENVTMRCFDEMIRLAAIDSPERGLLLQTIRDEIRMTLTCYKTILQNAVAFGAMKFLQTMDSVQILRDQVDELKRNKENLQKENQEMRIKMTLMDRQFDEEKQAVTDYRKTKLANLKRTIDQYIAMLDAVGVDKNLYRHLL